MSGLNSDKLIFVLLAHFLENIMASFNAGLCDPRSAGYLFYSLREMSPHHLKIYNCIISSYFWSNSEKGHAVSLCVFHLLCSLWLIDVNELIVRQLFLCILNMHYCLLQTVWKLLSSVCKTLFTHRSFGVFAIADTVVINKTLIPTKSWWLLGEFLLVFYANCFTVTPDSLSWKAHIQNVFSEPDAILLYWRIQLYYWPEYTVRWQRRCQIEAWSWFFQLVCISSVL